MSVGVLYTKDASEANSAVGGKNLSTGNEKSEAEALIADINRRGGILGRAIKPVFHGLDPTSAQTPDQQYQEACADFTQDHKVFVVLGGSTDDNFRSCLAKEGVTEIGVDLTAADSATFRNFPYYVEPASLNLDRTASVEIPALAAERYFGKDPRIGIVTFDEPEFAHAVDDVMVPALHHLGYSVAAIARVHRAQTVSEASQTSSEVSAAVLKFKSEGIDHVIWLEQSGLPVLFFLQEADKQKYYPRYAFNSQDGAEVLLDAGDVPRDQMPGAVGIGWLPVIDLPYGHNPYAGQGSVTRCLRVMRAHGIRPDSQNAASIMFSMCDRFFFLALAATNAGKTLNAADFMSAVNNLGSSFSSATTISTALSASRHDGVSAIAHYQYVNRCNCFHYASRPKSV